MKKYLLNVLKLTDEVKRLDKQSELLSERTIDIDKRVVRIETMIEMSGGQRKLPKK